MLNSTEQTRTTQLSLANIVDRNDRQDAYQALNRRFQWLISQWNPDKRDPRAGRMAAEIKGTHLALKLFEHAYPELFTEAPTGRQSSHTSL